MPLCDSSQTCMRVAWPKPSPADLRPGLAADASEVSRFSCMKFLDVLWGLRPRRTEQELALSLLSMLPSAHVDRLGVWVVYFRGSIPTPSIRFPNDFVVCKLVEKMVSAEGIESAWKRKSNHLQSTGWHRMPRKATLNQKTDCKRIALVLGYSSEATMREIYVQLCLTNRYTRWRICLIGPNRTQVL